MLIDGFIDSFEPMVYYNDKICCKICIGTKIKISTEELIRKVLKFRHYYYDGKIIIITSEINDFVSDLIKKINMTNLKYEVIMDNKNNI